MKIIHLSDLHLGYQSGRGSYTTVRGFEKIIRFLVDLRKPHSEYVVVITGDIVNDANDDGIFGLARDLIGELKAHFPVLLVPGNHDYGNGIFAKKKYVPRFKEYFFGDASVIYPKVDTIGNVAFFGLDSMADEFGFLDVFWANGELGRSQLRRLSSELSDEKYGSMIKVVYLHHHPFHPTFLHELKDSRALGETIAGKADVLLFGHDHSGANFNSGRGWRIPRCYDGGSSTRKQKMTSAVRVIDPDPKHDPRTDYIMEIITETDLEA